MLLKLLDMCINPSLVNDSGSSMRVELQQANYDITVRKFLGKLIGLGGFLGQAYPTRLFPVEHQTRHRSELLRSLPR